MHQSPLSEHLSSFIIFRKKTENRIFPFAVPQSCDSSLPLSNKKYEQNRFAEAKNFREHTEMNPKKSFSHCVEHTTYTSTCVNKIAYPLGFFDVFEW